MESNHHTRDSRARRNADDKMLTCENNTNIFGYMWYNWNTSREEICDIKCIQMVGNASG